MENGIDKFVVVGGCSTGKTEAISRAVQNYNDRGIPSIALSFGTVYRALSSALLSQGIGLDPKEYSDHKMRWVIGQEAETLKTRRTILSSQNGNDPISELAVSEAAKLISFSFSHDSTLFTLNGVRLTDEDLNMTELSLWATAFARHKQVQGKALEITKEILEGAKGLGIKKIGFDGRGKDIINLCQTVMHIEDNMADRIRRYRLEHPGNDNTSDSFLESVIKSRDSEDLSRSRNPLTIPNNAYLINRNGANTHEVALLFMGLVDLHAANPEIQEAIPDTGIRIKFEEKRIVIDPRIPLVEDALYHVRR